MPRRSRTSRSPPSRSSPQLPLVPPQRNRRIIRISPKWKPEEDDILLQARQAGMSWKKMASEYFGPSTTDNACRKRHQRLMEDRRNEEWERTRLQQLAVDYTAMREQIWAPLAARFGESWTLIESKCMLHGHRHLEAIARAYHMQEGRETTGRLPSINEIEQDMARSDSSTPTPSIYRTIEEPAASSSYALPPQQQSCSPPYEPRQKAARTSPYRVPAHLESLPTLAAALPTISSTCQAEPFGTYTPITGSLPSTGQMAPPYIAFGTSPAMQMPRFAPSPSFSTGTGKYQYVSRADFTPPTTASFTAPLRTPTTAPMTGSMPTPRTAGYEERQMYQSQPPPTSIAGILNKAPPTSR